MKSWILNVFPLVALTLNLVACGGPSSSPELNVESATGIISGDSIRPGSPLAMTTVSLANGHGKSFCSATVLAEDMILTAAHCVDGIDFAHEKIKVVFDVKVSSSSRNEIEVQKVLVHPDYKPFVLEQRCLYGDCPSTPSDMAGNSPGADLAVLLLSRSIPNGYRPVTLNTQGTLLDGLKKGVAAGYGSSALSTKNRQQSGSGTLRSMQSSLSYQKAAAKILINSTSRQSVCFGDSGGGLYASVNGRWIQVGVASHLSGVSSTSPCGARAAAYTSVSDYADWIQRAQKDLLAQKEFISAPWQHVRQGGAIIRVNSTDWLSRFLSRATLSCQAKDLQLKLTYDMMLPYISEQSTVSTYGTGIATAEIAYKGRSYKLETRTMKEQKFEESINLDLQGNDEKAQAFWKSTHQVNPGLYKALLAPSINAGLSFTKGRYFLSLNPYEESKFTFAGATIDRINLASSGAMINLMDLAPLKKGKDAAEVISSRADCRLTLEMRP